MPPKSPIRPTGIPKIDEDHQHLFEIMQDLLQHAQHSEKVCSILNQLKRYAAEHFEREQYIMSWYDYPPEQMHQHLLAHARFNDKLALFELCTEGTKKEEKSGLEEVIESVRSELDAAPIQNLPLPKQMVAFLTQWLIQHTNGMDQKIVQFLSQKGVDPSSITFPGRG